MSMLSGSHESQCDAKPPRIQAKDCLWNDKACLADYRPESRDGELSLRLRGQAFGMSRSQPESLREN